jgi:hypothetical protein
MNITDACLHLATSAQAMAVHAPSRGADDRGQTTAEYALVLLGAASIAMLIVAWTVRSDSIGSLLDAVLGTVVDKLK